MTEQAFRQFVKFMDDWSAKIYTVTDEFVEIVYEIDEGCKCSSRCNVERYYYEIPWDRLFKGEIEEFISEEQERKKKEKELEVQIAKEAQLLKEKQQAERKELEEQQLFKALKEKYETAK